MACFAKRSGKEEFIRLAETLADVEIPDKLDAVFGLVALMMMQALCASSQDMSASMFQLARLMQGEEP